METRVSDLTLRISTTTFTLHMPADHCRAPPVVHQYRRDQLTPLKGEAFICHTRITSSLVGETTTNRYPMRES